MASPLLQHPALNDINRTAPNPEVLIYALLGALSGVIFCLGWIYYLLYKYQFDENLCYKEFDNNEDMEEGVEYGRAASNIVLQIVLPPREQSAAIAA